MVWGVERTTCARNSGAESRRTAVIVVCLGVCVRSHIRNSVSYFVRQMFK